MGAAIVGYVAIFAVKQLDEFYWAQISDFTGEAGIQPEALADTELTPEVGFRPISQVIEHFFHGFTARVMPQSGRPAKHSVGSFCDFDFKGLTVGLKRCVRGPIMGKNVVTVTDWMGRPVKGKAMAGLVRFGRAGVALYRPTDVLVQFADEIFCSKNGCHGLKWIMTRPTNSQSGNIHLLAPNKCATEASILLR
jgi:hypothetical protein